MGMTVFAGGQKNFVQGKKGIPGRTMMGGKGEKKWAAPCTKKNRETKKKKKKKRERAPRSSPGKKKKWGCRNTDVHRRGHAGEKTGSFHGLKRRGALSKQKKGRPRVTKMGQGGRD